MSGVIDVRAARESLANLPEGTSSGETPLPEYVYLPRSHIKALDPNTLLVTGMRGAGKTFWWSALQNDAVRQLVGQSARRLPLNKDTEVRTGFGITPAPDEYPSKDVLRKLMTNRVEPRIIWRAVLAWHLAPTDHPLRQRPSWYLRTAYVADEPETIDRLLQDRDAEFDRKNVSFLILFDALDRCADDWKEMYRAIRGLLQIALDIRSYRRLRVKVFLRSDQIEETKIADFPDASKALSSAVELNWPRHELYGLLWHSLVNGQHGDLYRKFLMVDDWNPVEIGEKQVFFVPRSFISKEEHQRELFHGISGPWMGRGPKRGFPYTWIPNHLGDTEGRVSPRSFLSALQQAAENTTDRYEDHPHALHYESIKRGVQAASKIRVRELQEDYPWVHQVLSPLEGLVVPCGFNEIAERWGKGNMLDLLSQKMEKNEVKLPPLHIGQHADGIRQDLESLGVFLHMRDGRVNIPDVFRVGYGMGRKGGVPPIR